MPKGIKKTQEEFVEEFNSMNPNFEVVGIFTRMKDSIDVRCKLCGLKRDVEAKYSTKNKLTCKCTPAFKKIVYNPSRKTKTISHEQFMENFKTNNPKSDTIEVLGKYIDSTTPIPCSCKICGGEWDANPTSLSRKDKPYGCPICRGLKVVKGINDVATVRPDLVKYFANIEDAYTHTVGSCKEIESQCPLCGARKPSTPNRLSRQGFGCTVCADFVSYPNKFLKAFLEQLNLDFFKMECSPKWIKPYRLDSLFSYNGVKYVVEMDGALGHGKKDFATGGIDEEGLKRDKIKEDLIKQQGIQLIRIDCYRSDNEYIMKNILNSELSNIFDLSKIDWAKCDRYASKNILYKICELYESLSLEKQSTYYMSTICNMHVSSIRTYLLKGHNLGLCSYTPEKGREIGIKKTQESLRKRYARPVLVKFKDGSILKQYDSQYECLEDMNNKYSDKNFNLNGIISNCTGKVKSYRDFIFSYV